jgi:hypothetical protein
MNTSYSFSLGCSCGCTCTYSCTHSYCCTCTYQSWNESQRKKTIFEFPWRAFNDSGSCEAEARELYLKSAAPVKARVSSRGTSQITGEKTCRT